MESNKYSSNSTYFSHQKFNYIIGEFIRKLYQVLDVKTSLTTKLEISHTELNQNLNEIPDYRKILSENINQLKSNTSSNKEKKIFNTTVIQIDELIDTLIDRCIKNKIYYYIKNNIGYTQIKQTFKTHLTNYLNELINGDNYNLNQYFSNINPDDLDNYSDINSILLNKLKSNDAKRISFNTNNIKKKTVIESDLESESESDLESNISGSEILSKKTIVNNKKSIIKNLDTNNLSINQRLAIYIKILISQSIKVVEFVDKLTKMCIILYDLNIQYNVDTPYES
jgi:hypothetical protein